MLRSMNAGVSGLRSHQTMMDVVGNNIANVNTTGYKSSSVSFTDLLSQMIQGAGAESLDKAGTNPGMIGLGVRVAGITTNFAQGASQLTGRATDVSIQGDGFMVAKQSGAEFYTRNGSMQLDVNGFLGTVEGAYIQGWQADSQGNINTAAAVENVQIPVAQAVAPTQTTNVNIGGNLESTAALAAPVSSQITIYDTQGRELELVLEMTRTATNVWSVQPRNAEDNSVIGAATSITWNAGTNSWSPAVSISAASLNASLPAPLAARNFASAITVDISNMTQYGGATSVAATSQNGNQQGSLSSFSIGADGTITGSFTNGSTKVLARIATAVFNNPGGLEKVGGSLYRESVNSGLAQVGAPQAGGRGSLAGGTLEMSNVDLAAEFTGLIVAQRGFQANARVISASDEILQDLVNIKR